MSQPTRIPAVFIGHGSPMNAIGTNDWTAAWQALGRALPRPRTILAISAHWYTRGSLVTGNALPPTIHDFGGFPAELYQVRYDAPGDPALATQLVERLQGIPVTVRDDWGLDHGTWSVLVHVFPNADIPVVQLSVDATRPAAFHYALGQQLASLRDEGVLLLGSGGVVHNLARVVWSPAAAVPDWAASFDAQVRAHVASADHQPLVDYHTFGEAARLSVPTAEHYLPLLYVLGAQQPDERADFLCGGFDLGTISMTSLVVGAGR